MESIYFLRHGKLDLPFASHAEMPFAILADLGTGTLDPSVKPDFVHGKIASLSEQIVFSDVTKIYTSPSRRCKDTAILIREFVYASAAIPDIEVSQNLSEVYFDLATLDVNGNLQEAIAQSNMVALNESVFQGMMSGNCETLEQSYKRIDSFITSLESSHTTICICHDFIMRVIELYIRHNGVFTKNLTIDDLKNTYRNDYLQGFRTNKNLDELVRIE